MKCFKHSFFHGFLLMSALSMGQRAWSGSSLVEVGIDRIFIPSQGFDDNDTVEAVVDGQLTNICYTLEKTRVEFDKGQKAFIVKQFAYKRDDEFCADAHSKDTRAKTPVPFQFSVTLGRVPAGDYSIFYKNTSKLSAVLSRKFHVNAVAPDAPIDELPYAMVSGVKVSDVVKSGDKFAVEISGILNNSCYHLNKDVSLSKVDDVLILKPTVTIDQGDGLFCTMKIEAFSKTVILNALPQNRYLVHVRSMNGHSVNKAFSVADPANEPK